MIVIGAYGAACMQYNSDFTKKMRKEGYEDPFTRQRKIFNKFTKIKSSSDGTTTLQVDSDGLTAAGKEIKTFDPQLKYISVDDWIQQRKEYVAEQVYKNWPWEYFKNYLQNQKGKLDYMLLDHFPCMSADHQCNLFCVKFNTGDCFNEEEK